MTRRLLPLLALGAFVRPALADDAPGADAPHPRLVVLPFAALSGEVPPRAGTKAQGMLTTEFKGADTFTLLEPKHEHDRPPEASAEALTTARKAVEEARELRTKKKFRLADEALQRALTSYRQAATLLPDMGELADAWALASAVAYNTGRDEEGARSLAQALALAPDRELPLAQSSPLFTRVVADARKALKSGPKGTLTAESTPSNAPLTLDAVPLGATPLTVKDVPPGLHVWSVRLPSGETVGGVVDVTAGKVTPLKAQSASKDPETRLLGVLAQNRLDGELLAAAKDQAKASGADFVVFGAIGREGKGLTLESFLFVASSQEIRRLPRAQFDTELLSAGMEFYNLAGELAKKGPATGELVKLPTAASANPPTGGTQLAEARYGVSPGAETTDGDETAKEEHKPAEPKRRVPLKKQ